MYIDKYWDNYIGGSDDSLNLVAFLEDLKKEEIPLWAGALEIDLDKKDFSGYYELINWMCPAPLLERENPTWGLIVSALRRKECHI